MSALLPLTGLSAVFAGVIVSVVSYLKKLCSAHLPAHWQAKIPETAWYALAIIIPVAVCVALKVNDFASITGTALPANWQALGPAGTGVIIGVTASGTYKAKEALAKPLLAKLGATLPESSWKPPVPK